MALRIATWNINSIRRRLDGLARLAAEAKPDVICLQETKVQNEDFPREVAEKLGYRHLFIHGMKAYNGLAILSRKPMTKMETRRCVDREDCRYASAVIDGIEIHNCYVPAGGDIPDVKLNEKFAHKLDFLAELESWWMARRAPRAKAILLGDLNVAPLETDVWSHKQLLDVVSHTPIEVEHLSRVTKAHDWIDAVRHFIPPEQKLYSWWSYRNRDWSASDRGRRLDHVWVTPAMKASLKSAKIMREARGWDDASDHVPVVVEIR